MAREGFYVYVLLRIRLLASIRRQRRRVRERRRLLIRPGVAASDLPAEDQCKARPAGAEEPSTAAEGRRASLSAVRWRPQGVTKHPQQAVTWAAVTAHSRRKTTRVRRTTTDEEDSSTAPTASGSEGKQHAWNHHNWRRGVCG